LTDSLAFEVELNQPYEAAMDSVVAALKSEGFGVLTKIDVPATFKEKLGVEFRPYAILGTCNPPLAHRALSHDGRAGLMLPCTVTVEAADDESSIVRIVDPAGMLLVSGMDQDPVLSEIAGEARSRLRRVALALMGDSDR
jgi:uncharacterized protein (DUF302 family)